MIKKILSTIITLSLLLYANSIDDAIEAIQNAPQEERFKLMNDFKKRFIELQEEDRLKAMHKLIVSHNKENNNIDQNITQEAIEDKAHILNEQIELQRENSIESSLVEDIQSQQESENDD